MLLSRDDMKCQGAVSNKNVCAVSDDISAIASLWEFLLTPIETVCEALSWRFYFFYFSGSHIENWHSIMRTGLINASGTKHQVHGSAYGKGIYLSPQASVSFNYSGMGYGHHRAPKGSKVVSFVISILPLFCNFPDRRWCYFVRFPSLVWFYCCNADLIICYK